MRAAAEALAKTSRPKLSRIIPRRRLFALVEKERAPVVWIAGPPGSGKTTLAASYLDARKRPCLWYQMDAGDGDLASFFYYLGLAGRKANPGKRKAMPLLTPEHQAGLPNFSRGFFSNLYSRLKKPSCLVFDNYQDVPDASPLHDVMQLGLSLVPEGITVLVLSRSTPPPSLARLRAGGGVRMIGWDDLRLTLGETQDMVRRRHKKRITANTVRHMYDRTEGWAAGIVLIMEWENRRTSPLPTLETRGAERVFDYFASELFDKVDSETQDFLLKTAFLPSLTPRTAEQLTGNRKAGKILADLNRKHYFTQKQDDAEATYQYHALFRRFLLDRAENAIGAEGSRAVERAAAAILEEEGNIPEAALLAIRAGDHARVTGLVMAHAGPLLAQGRNRVVEGWIRSLPESAVRQSPWLLYWFGACRMPFDQNEARQYFEKAFYLFDAEKNREGVFLAWAARASAVFFAFTGFERLDELIAVLDGLIGKHGSVPPGEIDATVSSWMLIALIFRQPDHPDFHRRKEHALSVLDRIPDGNTRIFCMLQYISYVIFQGDFIGAAQLIREAKAWIRRNECGLLARTLAKLAEAMLCNITARERECAQAVSEGLAQAEASGVHALDAMLIGQLVWCLLAMNDRDGATGHLRRMESSLASARTWDVSFFHYLSAYEALERKDIASAHLHGTRSLELSQQVGALVSYYWCTLQCAIIEEERGGREAAREHFEKAREYARRYSSQLFEFTFLLAEAWFLLRRGKERECLVLLRRVLGLGRERGFITSFGWRNAAYGPLLARALTEGIEVDYVRDLLRRHNIHPPFDNGGDGGLWVEQWPWPVRVRTLGSFKIEINDKPLRPAGKVQKKPLELLKALIAFGGSEVGETRLAEALWPDAEGDAAQWSLKTTLKRLRRLLGNDQGIIHQEGKISLDQRYCWTDVWAFEHALESSEFPERTFGTGSVRSSELKGEKKHSEIVQRFERALLLYRGHFLSGDEDKQWALSLRERLRGKYLRAVERLGTLWEEAGKDRSAAAVYEKGLEQDDLAEDIYRRLMLCYQKMGRRAEALKVYERCRNAFARQLGIEPSEEIKALMEMIYHRGK